MTAPTRILVTGRPGSGKTTAVLRTLDLLAERDRTTTGFVSEEVRGADGRRLGFDLVPVGERAGDRVPLARAGLDVPVRVGRYGVAVEAVRGALALLDAAADVVVVDEIGPMELACPGFAGAVDRVLDAGRDLLATVHARRHPYTDGLRARDGIEVLEVTRRTRDTLPLRLADRLA